MDRRRTMRVEALYGLEAPGMALFALGLGPGQHEGGKNLGR